ncbi:sensor histidine kinase [Pseudocolwellia agarivorans]|uniref:sensor histidine kinase n=1 Tax=Pseudocolwellia agarivorans TaxID=1911682 RepID=UPI0009845FAC|nr:HAMP domain-containing sensor histidine kinase [Pseudocolwellia agarivorans]
MKLSLYQRLSLSLFGVFIAIVCVFYFWSQQVEQNTRYESEQQLHLSLAANLARDNPLLQQGVYDHDALENLFHTLMILGPAFEFYFADPQGNLLTHSIDDSLIKRNKIDLVPLIQLTRNKAPLPIYGDDPRHLTRKKVFSAAPVFNGTQLQGYLYVIVAGERYESAYNKGHGNRQVELSIVFAVVAILFLFAVMLGLFRYFTNPLRHLIADIHALKAVNFDKSKVKLHAWMGNSQNEVHQLGCVFHDMVQQINDQIEQLKQTDVHRRELLADISHDLRTPLASLQGYIETIAIKGDSITSEDRNKFIRTALKNSSQLKMLIDQIFELAHLEGGQVSMNLENFNLTELLYDVAAKFQLKAEVLNIKLSIIPEFSHIQVYSDIGKLERVLSNLIDNALRHTPAGGNIILETSDVNNGQCYLTVKDNGTGIKAEEIAYIFDARYRASNAIQGESKHAGLGLAITQKLLELLKCEIRVQSQLGEGTSFSLNLKNVTT